MNKSQELISLLAITARCLNLQVSVSDTTCSLLLICSDPLSLSVTNISPSSLWVMCWEVPSSKSDTECSVSINLSPSSSHLESGLLSPERC